jgi:hypothetical protein
MSVSFRLNETKISNKACSDFRELCGNKKISKDEIRAIIDSSRRRYHISNIGLHKGQDSSGFLYSKSSYLCIIVDGYLTSDGEQIIARRKIDSTGEYKGLHISTKKVLKQMMSKNISNFMGVILFENKEKQSTLLEKLNGLALIKGSKIKQH